MALVRPLLLAFAGCVLAAFGCSSKPSPFASSGSGGGSLEAGTGGAPGGIADDGQGGTGARASGLVSSGGAHPADAGGDGGAASDRPPNAPRSWAEWPMPNCPGDVAAGAPSPQSYTDNGDGTVTDDVTGLMWQRTVSSETYSWASALAFCSTLTLAGYTDWRLPSRIELVSIVDDSLTDATTDSAAFPGTPAGYFWTSSRLAGSLTDAWVVVFNGGTYTVLTSDSSYVRCVR